MSRETIIATLLTGKINNFATLLVWMSMISRLVVELVDGGRMVCQK
jgi:hypothetical protein